jgi:hypothetical protein
VYTNAQIKATKKKNPAIRHFHVAHPAVRRPRARRGARPKKAAKGKAGGQRPKTNREKINHFIAQMAAAGQKITKKDIWTVAGYKSRRDFEQFQANKKVTVAARDTFTRVLSMKPEAFTKLLQEKRAPVVRRPPDSD